MFKKSVCLFLAAMVFTLLVSGCVSTTGSSGTKEITEKTETTKPSANQPQSGGTSSSESAKQEKKPYKIGFSILGENTTFFVNVAQSMKDAAKEYGVELMYTIDDRDPQKFRQAVEAFVLQGADMVVDFTVLAEVGSELAKELSDKGIPMISVDCVYENAYFFGVNNLDAGKTAGKYLATQIQERWNGKVDAMLMLYAEANGPVVKQRVSGVFDGLLEAGINVTEDLMTWVNINTPGSNQTDINYVRGLVVDYLTANPDKRNIAVAACTDEMALAALAAIEASNREEHCMIISHNCDPNVVQHIKEGNPVIVGSVNYDSSSYGWNIIPACVEILDGVPYDQMIYNPVYVVSKENVNEIFPD